MTDEKKAENVSSDLEQSVTGLVEATKDLVQATANAERELSAFERQEARADRQVTIFEREVDLHAQDVASVKAHRDRMEEIARENAKCLASIAESLQVLQVLAKAANEGK